MTQVVRKTLGVTPLLIALIAITSFAADKPPTEQKTVIDPAINRSLYYSFPYTEVTHNIGRTAPSQVLGSSSPSASPGGTVGTTWRDAQWDGSMGRMVGFGTANRPLVHFGWTKLIGPFPEGSSAEYQVYDIDATVFGAETHAIGGGDDYSEYTNLHLASDNRAVVGTANREPVDGLFDPTVGWDFSPGASFFGATDAVPRALAEYGHSAGQEYTWPKFAYVEGASDTALHVLAATEIGGGALALTYFRRPGSDADPGAWDSPPYIIDTMYTPSHDIFASDNGKVAIAWTANLPCTYGDPDTASGYNCREEEQWDNDVYYQLSHDNGGSFQPRVNLTQYIESEQAEQDSYRAYNDLSALIDSNGDFHVAWTARRWYADGSERGTLKGRLFHWSENQPYIRTAHSFEWDQTTCNGGAWTLNAARPSLAECNGRLYVLFVQFNDIPNGVENDCASSSSASYPQGAANGELYVTASNDGGLTWNQPYNLTQSRTAGCDSTGGVGGPCESENWPSVAPFGTDVALQSGDANTEVVVPDGTTHNGWYLDVQYILDRSAGAVMQGEGFWQEADVRWFRLACYSPSFPPPPPPFVEIVYPDYAPHCGELRKDFPFENFGDQDITYTVTTEEDTGPSGWLTTEGFSGFIPAGLNNVDSGVIVCNTGGIVCDPGTIVWLTGRVIFEGNWSTSPDTIPVDIPVTDSVFAPQRDTVATACLELAFPNNGSFGLEGAGRVNMDYVDAGDCDTTADVYLYDGSPVVGWIDGSDTVMNWSVFGAWSTDPHGFIPQARTISHVQDDYETATVTFLSHDSSLFFEKTYYAPTDPDNCQYIIQRLRMWSCDGAPHDGLTLGEVVDWDVPSDRQLDNGSGFDSGRNLIWQYGAEYNQDDTTECQDNDARFAGLASLGVSTKSIDISYLSPLYGAYTADNPTYVYGNDHGFDPGELYGLQSQGGYSTYSSSNPDSQYVDLHSGTSFVHDYNLAVGETLVVFTALITIQNGDQFELKAQADAAKDWFCGHFADYCACCPSDLFCDASGDGSCNVSDLTLLVNYMSGSGIEPIPSCGTESDGRRGVTLRDFDLLWDAWQNASYDPPPWPRPPMQNTWVPVDSPDDELLVVNPVFPGGAASTTVDIWLSTSRSYGLVMLPFRVKAGDAYATITELNVTDLLGGEEAYDVDVTTGAYARIERYGVGGPVSGHLATVTIEAPVSGSDRPISLEWHSINYNGCAARSSYPTLVYDWNAAEALRPVLASLSPDCCGLRGDANHDTGVNVSDLTYLVDYLFKEGAAPPCTHEGNADGIGQTNVADLTYLVDYLFKGGPAPPPCPQGQ